MNRIEFWWGAYSSISVNAIEVDTHRPEIKHDFHVFFDLKKLRNFLKQFPSLTIPELRSAS